jgi:hypothetical protein
MLNKRRQNRQACSQEPKRNFRLDPFTHLRADESQVGGVLETNGVEETKARSYACPV